MSSLLHNGFMLCYLIKYLYIHLLIHFVFVEKKLKDFLRDIK